MSVVSTTKFARHCERRVDNKVRETLWAPRDNEIRETLWEPRDNEIRMTRRKPRQERLRATVWKPCHDEILVNGGIRST